MTKPTIRKKPSKIRIILLAPIFAVVFLVGWTLYYLGESNHKQKQKPNKQTTVTQEGITIGVIPQEEEQTLTV